MMADKVIMTPGVLYGDLMALGTQLAGKGGTIVVTGVAPMTQTESSVNLFELAMWNKEIKGTIFGSLNPRADIPRLLDLYRDGQLKLDELITNRYSLEEINDGLPGHARRHEHPRRGRAWLTAERAGAARRPVNSSSRSGRPSSAADARSSWSSRPWSPTATW